MRNDIRFTLTEDDFIDFQKNYFEHSDIVKANIKKQRIYLPILYLLIAVGMVMLYPGLPGFVGVGVLVVFGIISIATIRTRFLRRTIKTARKMVANGRGRSVLGPKRILLEEDSMTMEEESGVMRIALNKLFRVRESGKCVFVFRDEVSAIIVPKRVFTADADRISFVEHIKGRIEKQ